MFRVTTPFTPSRAPCSGPLCPPTPQFDWLVFMVAAVCVMFLGVEIGLGISIGLSILIVLYKTAFPHTAVLGHLPGTFVYRNIKQYEEAEQQPGMLLVRIDAPIFFANTEPIKEVGLRWAVVWGWKWGC